MELHNRKTQKTKQEKSKGKKIVTDSVELSILGYSSAGTSYCLFISHTYKEGLKTGTCPTLFYYSKYSLS